MDFIEDAPAQPKLQKAEAVVMDQRDMLFVPRVIALQQGQLYAEWKAKQN